MYSAVSNYQEVQNRVIVGWQAVKLLRSKRNNSSEQTEKQARSSFVKGKQLNNSCRILMLTGLLLFSSLAYALPFANGVPTVLNQASASVSVIADVNGDGKSDLVVSSQDTSSVYVYIGDGLGAYGAPTILSVGFGTIPQDVEVGDVTGDGLVDIVTANWGTGSISVFKGLGAGAFALPTQYPAGARPMAISLADLNADTVLDIVVANNGSSSISVMILVAGVMNTTTQAVGASPADIAIADMNADGAPDIVVANRGGNNTVSIVSNMGLTNGIPAWSWTGAGAKPVGNTPFSIALGDLDNNGTTDIVTANRLDNSVSILFSGVGPALRIPVGVAPLKVVLGDVNGDTKLDIVTANYGDQVWGSAPAHPNAGDVTVLLGTGLGQFNTTAPIYMGSAANAVALGQIDNDGKLDMVGTDIVGGKVKAFSMQPRFVAHAGWQLVPEIISYSIWTGSQYVALGSGGTILTSPDAVTWTVQTSGTTNWLNSVTWSGTQFVAVGQAGTILTSPDAVTWTAQTSGTTNWLNSVTWSGTQFVAVGGFGTILTSPDAVTWTVQTSGTTNGLNSVTWNGTQFVAVGDFGKTLTSPDAVTWTAQTSATLGGLYSVTWSGTQFVGVGAGGTILTSPDAVTWTAQTSGTNSLYSVTWSGTQFVAVGGGGTILTSPDVVTWTAQTSGTTKLLSSVIWSGTQFVAVGSGGTILTSPDAVTWTAQTLGTTKQLNSVIWSGTQFVAVGAAGTILTSPDAVKWTAQTSGTTKNLFSVTWNGTQFVAVGAFGKILTSPDAVTWTAQTLGTTKQLSTVIWSGTQFVAVGSGGTILTSPDAVTWTAQPSFYDIISITCSGTQFVAVGVGGIILTSPDAVTWAAQTLGSIKVFKSVTWNGTQFVVVGDFGTILTSPDAVTWTAQTSGTTNWLNSVTWSGTQFVAVGSGGTILTSPDAVTWTAQTLGTTKQLSTVIWSGTQFVAVGDVGTILRSSSSAPTPITPTAQPWLGDLDGDGVFNVFDAFPNDRAASVDTDGDGYPNAWNSNATTAQIAASALTLDAFPNNPTRWLAINQPPAPTAPAINTTFATAGTSQVAANDPNAGDAFTYTVSTAARSGLAVVDTSGLSTYTPNTGFSGTDSFMVTVTDNGIPQKSGTVTIQVTVAAPVAHNTLLGVSLNDVNGNGSGDMAVLGKRTDTGQYVVRVKDPNLVPHLIVEIALNNAYLPVAMMKVPDLNANGAADIAVLEVDPVTGKSVQIQVKDGLTGALIANIPVNTNYKPHNLVVLGDVNGNGSSELALSEVDPVTGKNVQIQVKDALTGALIVNIPLNPNYKPHQLVALGDANGSGTPDLALSEVDAVTGNNAQIQVKDGLTGALIANILVNTSKKPHQLVALGDANGSGTSDIALSEVDAVTGNNAQIQVKDGGTGALIVNIPVNTSKKPHQLVALGDANGNGTPDLALSEVDAVTGNNAQIQVKDGGTGALIRNINVNTSKKPHQLVVVADTNANGSAELALSEIDAVTGKNIQIQVKDSGTGVLIVNIPVNPNYYPLELGTGPDSNGNGVEELGLLERNGAGNVQVQIKDALTGGVIGNLPFPNF